MKKNGPIVHVYVEQFPFLVDNEEIFPPARASEIQSCANESVRSQKFYVWKLLERALLHSFGLELQNLDVTRSESGQWVCSQCYFSLSHSGNVVAVAVSNAPVGIDVEKRNTARFSDSLAKKFATKRELDLAGALSLKQRGEFFNALWTKKEAVFKMLGNKSFQPTAIETDDYTTVTKLLSCNHQQYYLAVASEHADSAILHTAQQISCT